MKWTTLVNAPGVGECEVTLPALQANSFYSVCFLSSLPITEFSVSLRFPAPLLDIDQHSVPGKDLAVHLIGI